MSSPSCVDTLSCLSNEIIKPQAMTAEGPFPSARQASPPVATDAESVAAIAAGCVPGWSARRITPVALTGGTTNAVWKCTLEDEPDGQAVLVRVYGPRTEILINRPLELKLCAFLGKFGLTEPVYGSFSNGFVVGFVPGRTLTYTEMPMYHESIAREMARWHSFDATPILGPREPCLWSLLHSWLEAASQPPATGPIPAEPQSWGAVDPDAVVAEVAFLERLLRKPSYPVVLCHNDVQSLNVIVQSGGVRLIDLEYTAWNYPYWDVANHFCEYGGLSCDYSLLPKPEAQRAFLRAYLCAANGVEPDDALLERWRRRVDRFILASHLQWGIWGLFQARESGCGSFDYVAYAESRFSAYEEARAALGLGVVHIIRRS